MIDHHQGNPGRRGPPWRIILWCVPLFLLLLPLATGAPWTPFDFAVMGALLLAAGVGVEGALRASGDTAFRLGAAVALAAAFLLLWVNLAVGVFGDEGQPANLVFLGVIAVALGGGILARFTAAGMARAMVAAAICQAVVGGVGLVAGWGAPGTAATTRIAMGIGLFTGLWLASAALFATAARRGRDRAGNAS